MYQLIRKLLFELDPEKAHRLALASLHWSYRFGLTAFIPKIKSSPREVMGLSFPNPIGLAAGLDKNGEYIDALASLGFGFIEIGTVVPKPQEGNPKPRLFRLTNEEALINRLGFPSKGVDYVVKQLEKIQYRGILGINIGKNKATANENALDDYLFCFEKLWKYASYITINISSPNTPGLRDLQQIDSLTPLLKKLKQAQHQVMENHKKYVPLVVKISPDLSKEELINIGNVLIAERIDGVIATNTTLSRDGVEGDHFAKESGGLSGKPLQIKSTHVIKELREILQNQMPIIGVGGILDYSSAQEKLHAGANLLQIYTGFIYKGPGLIRELSKLT